MPDSLSNPLESQGHILYRVKPKATSTVGTEYQNVAQIYFDFNPAIVTNVVTKTIVEATATAELSKAAPLLFPNPTHHILHSKGDIKAVVTLRSVDGQVKWEGPLAASMDLRQLASGPYIATIVFANGQKQSQVIILQ